MSLNSAMMINRQCCFLRSSFQEAAGSGRSVSTRGNLYDSRNMKHAVTYFWVCAVLQPSSAFTHAHATKQRNQMPAQKQNYTDEKHDILEPYTFP